AFEAAYRALFTRTLRGLDVEVLTWTVSISTAVDPPLHHADPVAVEPPAPSATRPLFDPGAGAWLQASVWRRDDLPPGTIVAGPAIVEEDQTTVVVAPSFTLRVHGSGALVLESDRSPQPGGLTP
ncbi:MAG: hypothetical protein OEY23_21465, partial [Acidimicrobiia bacterium]|nr:hypothetical protein [Acidimicrobiia bacterium]